MFAQLLFAFWTTLLHIQWWKWTKFKLQCNLIRCSRGIMKLINRYSNMCDVSDVSDVRVQVNANYVCSFTDYHKCFDGYNLIHNCCQNTCYMRLYIFTKSLILLYY